MKPATILNQKFLRNNKDLHQLFWWMQDCNDID
uniref:Uncharacterized protein n=1 Tax=Arundo donax TaxID=35708 RepID=A0A0A9HAS7_ARUDO